jgi:hypothetical protein
MWPKRETLRFVSELAANGSLAVAAIVAALFLVDRLRDVRTEQGAAVAIYDESEKIPEGLPQSVFEARRVVLLHVRSTCGFCTASMPFYRKLASLRAAGNKIVVVGSEPDAVLSAYLAKQGLKPDDVVQINRQFFRDNTTPLVVVTDSARTVLRSWMGMLDGAGEQEVLKMVSE